MAKKNNMVEIKCVHVSIIWLLFIHIFLCFECNHVSCILFNWVIVFWLCEEEQAAVCLVTITNTDWGLLVSLLTQFKSCPSITDQTVQNKTVIKLYKMISTAHFRSDGRDEKLRKNCVINYITESVSLPTLKGTKPNKSSWSCHSKWIFVGILIGM
jgi:hypothetical protein